MYTQFNGNILATPLNKSSTTIFNHFFCGKYKTIIKEKQQMMVVFKVIIYYAGYMTLKYREKWRLKITRANTKFLESRFKNEV